MNLSTETISNLRTLLVPMDSWDARLRDLVAQTQQAKAAASRLAADISNLDKQASEGAGYRIKADQERIAALIKGGSVSLPDQKDIEAHARRDQVTAVHRLQVSDDLAAVQSHIDELTTSVGRAQSARDAAELTFLSSLAEAIVEGYKREATEFVRTQMPPLHALAGRIAKKTGAMPGWWYQVVLLCQIRWTTLDPDGQPQLGGHPAVTDIILWPRHNHFHGDKLVTGEAANSPAIVEALIAGIRDPSADLQARIEAALTGNDASLAAGDLSTAAAVP